MIEVLRSRPLRTVAFAGALGASLLANACSSESQTAAEHNDGMTTATASAAGPANYCAPYGTWSSTQGWNIPKITQALGVSADRVVNGSFGYAACNVPLSAEAIQKEKPDTVMVTNVPYADGGRAGSVQCLPVGSVGPLQPENINIQFVCPHPPETV